MTGFTEGNGPSYISSHSADVILSDIRPIKLKIEALKSINVLLDEFLYNILSSSHSLSTDKLRASLLSLLPTSLGKEALLEAEVELRAYWERTAPAGITPPREDDSRTFNLQWAFELLRLKCEAFSTLNEADEDPGTETHINERLGRSGASPPKAALVAPAALYLTAILEATCEHILSNVGRVAARDSSRTSATVNDLFVALCEDDSIYCLFRAMKVYDQIEQLSKNPKSRRSKSFSRIDKTSSSRTSSPHHELALVNSLTGSRSRQSSEGSVMTTTVASSTVGSRSSFDKTRAMRMFVSNSKASLERDGSQNRHKKSESVMSETSRQTGLEENDVAEDVAMLQEFDDLMRSTSTMKVSLTPDRLKTMEVYKQEKDQRSNRRPVPLSFKPETEPPSSHTPSLRHVDSIVEDDEESSSPKQFRTHRIRQASVATPPSASSSTVPNRTRSVSTSSPVTRNVARTPVRSPNGNIPSSFPPPVASPPPSSNAKMVQSREHLMHRGREDSGFPPRTRIIQKNRESLDLDDVMGGSDDEDLSLTAAKVKPRQPVSPKRSPSTHGVSSRTRELMDFLAEGPPEPPVSKEGKEMLDFLAQGPPSSLYNSSAISLDSKPKAGRLQRMISKLNLGNTEKAKGSSNSPLKLQHLSAGRPGVDSSPMQHKPSTATLSSLANRPIPPRPPRPISPPSSPSPSRGSFDENFVDGSPRTPSVPQEAASVRGKLANSISTIPIPHTNREVQEKPISRALSSPVNGNGNAKNGYSVVPTNDTLPVIPSRTTSHPASPTRKPVPAISPSVTATDPPAITPTIASQALSATDARDMQRLLSSATTADECRIIFDMFLARSGITGEPKAMVVPYPSPSPSLVKQSHYTVKETSLETSLVELLLGGSAVSEFPPRPRRQRLSKP